MRTLLGMLRESDPGMYPAIAQSWNLKIDRMNEREIPDFMGDSMLQPDIAEHAWDKLDSDQQNALRLLASTGREMSITKFDQLFGSIRKLGKGGIEREQPHLSPESVAEALFYRGFIGESFEQTSTGLRPILYVPDDLVEVLPLNKTSYSDLETADVPELPTQGETALLPMDEEDVSGIQPANTTIVDDMTTLLAYIRVYDCTPERGQLSAEHQQKLMPFLLNRDENRLAMLTQIALSADLVTAEEKKFKLQKQESRKWLGLPRSQQVKWLVQGWLESAIYGELWHMPGLVAEDGWAYDHAASRSAILHFITELAPIEAWWSVDDLIDLVKESEPDFQRPGSDYDSWYIRNEEGDYLKGFQSWDAVDGALIEFVVMSCLHWLGLADIAEDAVRLNGYGRAFLWGKWVNAPDEEETVIIHDDGLISASRKVSRIERFQLARFTTWRVSEPLYEYQLDAKGIQRAIQQGISSAQITAFLIRHLDDEPMPENLANLLEVWQKAKMEVTVEQLLVLRTTSSHDMDDIFETPETRQYLGARLGATACVVRPEALQGLQDALGENGIKVEIIQ